MNFLSFAADGALFRLVSEALRLRWAHLFDPYLGLYGSLVEPLPHQVTAVYGVMLRRQPLRFLLADDPGAGKTIMTGLLMKELWVRRELGRCLVVAPGNLVVQWQEELVGRFGLPFELLSDNSDESDEFSSHRLLIGRLDKLARDERLQERLGKVAWDLIVCDEAHKMSATFFGGKVRYTKRYRLGQRLSAMTRHFLLLTATPHHGKEADFQLFLALLDADRFEGRFREGVHRVEVGDLMRRMVKEELVRFDGTPLFPERRAVTVPYRLSEQEARLYEAVTAYVREEFNRVEALADGGRKGTVGFALLVLQRRLASSPEAIYQSLRRRRERLEGRLQQVQWRSLILAHEVPLLSDEDLEALDETPAAEVEWLEEQLLDQATAARTVAELALEIATLRSLEQEALALRKSGLDRKWNELSRLLQDEGEMFNREGQRRKLVIFTEHRDTLNYLAQRIRVLLGRAEAVVLIYGGMSRKARREAEAAFKEEGAVQVLVATDAAGEGINLQQASMMINYDLPWNPNRLEQRFGRIHRIGQREVCHLWNLVADQTREGHVYLTLLRKLERTRAALGGAVFDVLGQALEGVALHKLMVEAIRYGDQPEIRARLREVVEGALDHERLQQLLQQQGLPTEILDAKQVGDMRQQMVRLESHRFQPYYVGTFFKQAFEQLGGRLRQRERERYEITRVPPLIRAHSSVRGRIEARYKRVCFDKAFMTPPVAPPRPLAPSQTAELICPGHPLLEATVEGLWEQYGALLAQGAILLDENEPKEGLRLLFYVEHAIAAALPNKDGSPELLSRRLQFIELSLDDEQALPQDAGYAPYLDYRPLHEAEEPLIMPLLSRLPSDERLSRRVLDYTRQRWQAEQLAKVQQEQLPLIRKQQVAIKARLTKEIYYWDNRARQLQEDELAGKRNASMNAAQASQRADALLERLQKRMEALEAKAQGIKPLPPLILGKALIVPYGRLQRLQGQREEPAPLFARETKRIELAAMATVMVTERALGYEPQDVGSLKLGYDILSQKKDGSGEVRLIEVKGRIEGAETVTITRNEILTALNKPQAWILALVEVRPDPNFPAGDIHASPPSIPPNSGREVSLAEAQTPYTLPTNCSLRYLRQPFRHPPDHDVTSVNYNWRKLWQRGTWPS